MSECACQAGHGVAQYQVPMCECTRKEFGSRGRQRPKDQQFFFARCSHLSTSANPFLSFHFPFNIKKKRLHNALVLHPALPLFLVLIINRYPLLCAYTPSLCRDLISCLLNPHLSSLHLMYSWGWKKTTRPKGNNACAQQRIGNNPRDKDSK